MITRTTPRALTVLAVAILIATPALIRFATGGMALFDVALYLAIALGIAFVGLSVLSWIWGRYAAPREPGPGRRVR